MTVGQPSGARASAISCPSCGGAVDLGDDRLTGLAGQGRTECRYCGSAILLPSPGFGRPLLPRTVPPAGSGGSGGRAGAIGAVLVVVLLLLGVGALALHAAGGRSGPTVPGSGAPSAAPTNGGFATVVRHFGGKGVGTGLMQDAAFVAADGTGGVWVGDRSDGRVQEFGATGAYVRTISLTPDSNGDTNLRDLATDRQGHLYVVTADDILQYDQRSGALLRTIKGTFPQTDYDRVTVDAVGHLFALHVTASENSLTTLDGTGKVLARWHDFTARANKKDPGLALDVAVDGLGTIYVTSGTGFQVYRFDRTGQFVDRFGDQGTGPGQFASPRGVTVDGSGRVYVADLGRIMQFDRSGRFLAEMRLDPSFGPVVGLDADHDRLHAVSADGVVAELQLKPPAG